MCHSFYFLCRFVSTSDSTFILRQDGNRLLCLVTQMNLIESSKCWKNTAKVNGSNAFNILINRKFSQYT